MRLGAIRAQPIPSGRMSTGRFTQSAGGHLSTCNDEAYADYARESRNRRWRDEGPLRARGASTRSEEMRGAPLRFGEHG